MRKKRIHKNFTSANKRNFNETDEAYRQILIGLEKILENLKEQNNKTNINGSKYTHDGIEIIRIGELSKKLGLSRSAIYDRLREGSPRYDASFPKRISLGNGSVGWVLAEVENWISNEQKSVL